MFGGMGHEVSSHPELMLLLNDKAFDPAISLQCPTPANNTKGGDCDPCGEGWWGVRRRECLLVGATARPMKIVAVEVLGTAGRPDDRPAAYDVLSSSSILCRTGNIFPAAAPTPSSVRGVFALGGGGTLAGGIPKSLSRKVAQTLYAGTINDIETHTLFPHLHRR